MIIKGSKGETNNPFLGLSISDVPETCFYNVLSPTDSKDQVFLLLSINDIPTKHEILKSNLLT